ncbi:MAG TPA: hypothetical protein VMV91_14340 [Rhodocyclaceae bacterium]|nr:hypothetical protein [Rhodocyclaceae bacterium]
MRGNLLGGKEEGLQLLMEDGLQIGYRNLVPATLADILREDVGRHIHLRPAVAECEPGEKLLHVLGLQLSASLPPLQDRVAFVPEFLRDDSLDFMEHPFALRLQVPRLLAVLALGVVGAADAFGGRVLHEATDGGVGELGAAPGAEPALVQEPSHGLLPLVFAEELVHELPYRRLIGMRDELSLYPLIPERCLTAERLAHLGAHRHRRRNPLGNLFPFPLRHRGNHGVEETAGRAGGVD